MKNKVIIKLPCPVRVGLFSLNKKKKVGFSFDNLSAFLFRENIGVENGKQLNEWVKVNGNNQLFIETVWAAVQSHAMHERIKLKISKDKFIQGLSLLSKEDSEAITKAWNHSTTYGYKEAPGRKKKAKQKSQ